MKENEKGFTLLEMSLSFTLFAILLESIWGIFSVLYMHSIELEQQIKMSHEAAAVEEFIRQEIRSADKVCIITTLGDQIETNYLGYSNNPEVKDQPLKSIKYQVKIPKTNGLGYTQKECEIVLFTITSDPTKGAKKLNYIVRSIGGTSVVANNTLVSEMIENIKVTRYKNSNVVEFTCEIHKKNESNPRLKIVKKFTESLEYKGHY